MPSWLLPVASFITLVAGTANMICVKWSGRQVAPRCADVSDPACDPAAFNAPFAQQACNCLGQAVCLLIHWGDTFIARSRGQQRGWLERVCEDDSACHRDKPKIYAWIIPAFCDFVGSVLILYALYVSSASNVQVLRNFNLVVCAILSVFWLGSTLRVFHWVGILVMTIGFILTGIDSAIHPEPGITPPKHSWLGSLLSLIGTSLSAFQLVFEEHLFRKYSCSPFEAVGWVGTHEILMTGLAILIAHYTKLEDATVSAYQSFHHPIILLSLSLFVVCVALFTAFGLATTKIASALLTATLFGSRQVLVWVLEIALGWNRFYWLAFLGIFFVLFGFFLYNHLVPTRCCGWYENVAMREWRWEFSCYCSDDLELSGDEEDEDASQSRDQSRRSRADTSVETISCPERPVLKPHASMHSIMTTNSSIARAARADPFGPDTRVLVVAKHTKPSIKATQDCTAWIIIDKEEVCQPSSHASSWQTSTVER